MKPKYSILLLLLLLIQLYGSTTIAVKSIDPGDPDFNQYLTSNPMAIVFTIDHVGHYAIRLWIGNYENTKQFYIVLKEGGLDGYIIADEWINASQPQLTIVFDNITLTANTYALAIQPIADASSSNTFYILGVYRSNTVDDLYEYYDDWYEIGKDAAIDIISIDANPLPPPPHIKIVGIDLYVDHADIHFTVRDFKPGSTVEVALVYREPNRETAISDWIHVTVDSNGYGHGKILSKLVYREMVLKAKGYDKNGQYVVVYSNATGIEFKPRTFMDTIGSWFNTLFIYAGLIFATVKAIVPYASTFYVIALLGSVFKCIKELSITPLFDFFVKQYNMLIGLANVGLKVAEKVYNALRTVADWIVRAVLFILAG